MIEPCIVDWCLMLFDRYEECSNNDCREMFRVLIEFTCKFSGNHQQI